MATLSDETGTVNIIEVEKADDLQEEQYYCFILYVKMDKDEAVLMSYHCEKLTDFNRIAFHFSNIMFIECRPK